VFFSFLGHHRRKTPGEIPTPFRLLAAYQRMFEVVAKSDINLTDRGKAPEHRSGGLPLGLARLGRARPGGVGGWGLAGLADPSGESDNGIEALSRDTTVTRST
jgi:hypothetical protein